MSTCIGFIETIKLKAACPVCHSSNIGPWGLVPTMLECYECGELPDDIVYIDDSGDEWLNKKREEARKKYSKRGNKKEPA